MNGKWVVVCWMDTNKAGEESVDLEVRTIEQEQSLPPPFFFFFWFTDVVISKKNGGDHLCAPVRSGAPKKKKRQCVGKKNDREPG